MPEQSPSKLWTLLTALLLLVVGLALVRGFSSLDYDWDFASLKDYLWVSESQTAGLLLHGLWGTLWVSALSILLGTLVGLLVGIVLYSGSPFARAIAHSFVEIFRNTPVLVQLYVMYFVVASAFHMTPEQAGVATLSLFAEPTLASWFEVHC